LRGGVRNHHLLRKISSQEDYSLKGRIILRENAHLRGEEHSNWEHSPKGIPSQWVKYTSIKEKNTPRRGVMKNIFLRVKHSQRGERLFWGEKNTLIVIE